MITAWYGMNMPNRISVKTRFAPRNVHRESTNPLSEPRKAAMIADGMTICTVRQIAGDSAVHAACQFSVVHSCGSAHARAGDASPVPLNDVTKST